MQRLNRPESQQIENGSEVDPEGIIPGAAEHFAPVRQCADRRRGQARFVVRRRARADVPRRDLELAADLTGIRSAARSIDARHRVKLAHVQIRIIELAHWPSVYGKRVSVK